MNESSQQNVHPMPLHDVDDFDRAGVYFGFAVDKPLES
jgi:hypothetical protein